MRRLFFLSGCVALAACLLTSLTSAQDNPQQKGRRPGGFGGGFGGMGGGPGGGLMGRGSRLMLVGLEAVQKELEISEEQLASLKGVRDEAQKEMQSGFQGFEGFRGIRELPEEEQAKKREELRAKMEESQKKVQEKLGEIEKKALDVLLPHQRDRLEQISIQIRGLSALQDPEVAKMLGINDEQKQKLTDIRTNSETKMREVFGGGNRGERPSREAFEEGRKKMDELRKESETATLDVLTADQKEQFEKLKGEKFDLPQQGRGFGGQGGQPPRKREAD